MTLNDLEPLLYFSGKQKRGCTTEIIRDRDRTTADTDDHVSKHYYGYLGEDEIVHDAFARQERRNEMSDGTGFRADRPQRKRIHTSLSVKHITTHTRITPDLLDLTRVS